MQVQAAESRRDTNLSGQAVTPRKSAARFVFALEHLAAEARQCGWSDLAYLIGIAALGARDLEKQAEDAPLARM